VNTRANKNPPIVYKSGRWYNTEEKRFASIEEIKQRLRSYETDNAPEGYEILQPEKITQRYPIGAMVANGVVKAKETKPPAEVFKNLETNVETSDADESIEYRVWYLSAGEELPNADSKLGRAFEKLLEIFPTQANLQQSNTEINEPITRADARDIAKSAEEEVKLDRWVGAAIFGSGSDAKVYLAEGDTIQSMREVSSP